MIARSQPHNIDTANSEYITWLLMVFFPCIKNCWNEFGAQPIVSALFLRDDNKPVMERYIGDTVNNPYC